MASPPGRCLSACLVMVVTLLASCSDGTAIPELTVAAEARSPAPVGGPGTPEESAAVAAERLVTEFYRVEAAVRADPAVVATELDRYETVAIGPLLQRSRTTALQAADAGVVQEGAFAVVETTVRAVDLHNDRDVTPGAPSVLVHACVDASAARVTGADGGVVPAPDEALSLQWDIRNYDYPDPAGWRIWDFTESELSC